MIRLFVSAYTKNDREKLVQILQDANAAITKSCCHDCNGCLISHVCEDMASLYDYSFNKLKECEYGEKAETI